jgi:hypothetical protein
MANKSIDLPGYFTCPSCVMKDLVHDNVVFFPVHLEPGVVLAGTRYCQLCAEELLDGLVVRVDARLQRQGKIAWGTSHAISLSIGPGDTHVVTLSCPRQNGGLATPLKFNEPNLQSYQNLLASIVEAHYADLKRIMN